MQEELCYVLMVGSYYQIIPSEPDYSFNHERKLYITLVENIEEGIKEGYFKSDTDSNEITETSLQIGRGDIIDWCLKSETYRLSQLIVKNLKRMLYSIMKIYKYL